MAQSKRASLAEAVANTVSGFIISVCLSYLLMPFYGVHFRWLDSLSYTAVFTVVTTTRSYVWRRVFNKSESTL